MLNFFESHLADVYLVYGVAFLVLGCVVAMLPRKGSALPFARNLWLIAAFGLLHGSYELVFARAILSPQGGGLPRWQSAVWLLLSFLPLLEFGRRLMGENRHALRTRVAVTLLRPPVFYAIAGAALGTLTLWSAAPAAGLAVGARYFIGFPGAMLAGAALLLLLREESRRAALEGLERPLWIATLALLAYGLLTPFVAGVDPGLPRWLPTSGQFAAALGVPVAVPRALAAVALTYGLATMTHGANAAVRDMASVRRENEHRLAEAQRMARMGSWELDLRANVLHWSDEIFRIFEIDKARFGASYEAFLAAIHPEDREAVNTAYTQSLETRTPYEITHRLRMADGRIKHVHERCETRYDAQGKAVLSVGTVQDITDRVEADKMLRESESRMRLLLANAPVIVYTVDRHGVFTVSEGRELAAVNRRPGEVVGQSAFDVFAHLPERLADIRRGLRGEAFTSEVQVDGFWFESRHQPILDSRGQVDGAVVVSTNITEQKRAHLAIAESREQLATTLRSIGDAVITTDARGRVDLMNPVAEQLTGWALTEAKGRPLTEVFHIVNETTRAEVESPVNRVLREGKVVGLANHTALIARDGSERPIADSGAPIRAEEGPMLGVVLVFRDQTEERRAEAALRESEARYRRIVENNNEGIFTVDADFRISFVNPRMAEMLGYPAGQLLGRPVIELIPDDERTDGELRQMRGRMGVSSRFERKYRKSDGNLIAVQISSVPMFDDARNFAGVTNMVADVTERKNLEQQFLQSQKMEAVGRLAGGVAHDFNNLLTVILGYSAMLARKLPPGDPLHTYVEQMVKAGERSRDLTRSLLAFSRHRAAQVQVMSLSEIVTGLEPMLRRLMGEDIDLVTHLGKARGKVRVDPGQIEQVIMNLVVNARDAMPKGGRLAIEVTREELTSEYAEKHLGVQPGQYMRLTVTDSGEGMSKDALEHLFEPFFTTKPPGKGTGLGLSTVYGIVRNCGGHVWVYSEAGHGTTFKVYLPEADGAETAVHPPRPAISAGGSETILLVEDDEAVRELVRLVLHDGGYRVLPARGAADALEQCQTYTGTIHLLLTDMVMPQVGGRELAELVRTLRPAIKVIFMSGYTEDTALGAGALPAGARFVQKPVLPDVLKAQVRQVLEG